MISNENLSSQTTAVNIARTAYTDSSIAAKNVSYANRSHGIGRVSHPHRGNATLTPVFLLRIASSPAHILRVEIDAHALKVRIAGRRNRKLEQEQEHEAEEGSETMHQPRVGPKHLNIGVIGAIASSYGWYYC